MNALSERILQGNGGYEAVRAFMEKYDQMLKQNFEHLQQTRIPWISSSSRVLMCWD